ncbi:MAG: LSM domain-containing protein [Thermoprotei archaeon]
MISRRLREEETDRNQQSRNTNVDTPLRLLKRALNAPVIVKLKDGEEYRGILNNYDPTMNIVLEDSKQVDENGNALVSFGKILIRGNNILYIVIGESANKPPK